MVTKRAPGRQRYVEQVLRDGKGVEHKITVHVGESPIMWLKSRKMLDNRQFLAGEALRRDWERARMAPRVTMRWDGMPPPRQRKGPPVPADRSTAQIIAHRRLHRAMDEAGPGLCDILWRVVCAGQAIADAEKALNWPTRSGKLVLKLALDRVADFYRID